MATSQSQSQSESETTLILMAWTIFKANYLLFIPLVLILNLLRRRYGSPLRRFPGPVLASCTRLWKVWSTASGHTELDHIALHRKYGKVVRIAPNEVSLASPLAAREILAAGKGFHKTDFYGVFPPPENPDIFTETREAVHAQKKRVAAAPYSMNAMQQLAGFVEDTIGLLLQKIDGFAAAPPGTVFDLGDYLHYFAFDVLGEIAFSKKFGFLAAGYDVDGAIRTIDDSQWYNGIVGQVPFLDHLLRRNPLWHYVPFLSTKNALITTMALQEMDAREKAEPKDQGRTDLLASLLKGHHANPDKFGKGDVFAVAHGAIFAGSDSTASTMQSFFHSVLRNPAIYAALVAEVLAAQADGRLSPLITWTEAQNLPYFQACLKEAMRVRPAVGLNITRLVPPGGAVIDGVRFDAGTRVAVNAWVLHRDQHIFGRDADLYRPERWLEADKESNRIRSMDRHMYQFGGGSHLCIGKNLALLEMNKVLPTLLRDYEFELLHPDRDLKYHSTFFVVQSGLEVYVKKRESR